MTTTPPLPTTSGDGSGAAQHDLGPPAQAAAQLVAGLVAAGPGGERRHRRGLEQRGDLADLRAVGEVAPVDGVGDDGGERSAERPRVERLAEPVTEPTPVLG